MGVVFRSDREDLWRNCRMVAAIVDKVLEKNFV